MSFNRSLVLALAGMVAGAVTTYLYVFEDIQRSKETARLVMKFAELNERYQRLESEKATYQRNCVLHEQQEGVFFAEATARGIEVQKLQRRLLVLASRHNDTQALRELLTENRYLAQELSSPTFQENWLHAVARSQVFGIDEVAKVFIDFGVDRDAKNTAGQRPVDVAKKSGRWEVVEVLQGYTPAKPIRVSSITP